MNEENEKSNNGEFTYVVHNKEGKAVFRSSEKGHKITVEDGVLYIERFPGVVEFAGSIEEYRATLEYVKDIGKYK